MDKFSMALNNTAIGGYIGGHIGGHIGGQLLNHLCYVDDMCDVSYYYFFGRHAGVIDNDIDNENVFI